EAAAATIRFLLFADVLADLFEFKAHRGHGVPTGPKVLAREIPLFATQAGHRYGALPFQKSHHRSDRILRGNRDAHVHVVRQQVSLDDLALLLPPVRGRFLPAGGALGQTAPCIAASSQSHNAYVFDAVTIYYPWHPLVGKSLRVF